MPYIKTKWEDRIVEKPRTFILKNNEDGSISLIPSPGKVMQQGTPVVAVNLNQIEDGIKEAIDLKSDSIRGTTQKVEFIERRPSKILHMGGGKAVRTDSFDYSKEGFIVETRTLSTGESITYKYNLKTLDKEVI